MASTINAAGDSDAKKIADLLRYEADTKNIMTILRLKRGNTDKGTIMKHVARGGRLSRATLEKIAAAKDMSEALSLSTTIFKSQPEGASDKHNVDWRNRGLPVPQGRGDVKHTENREGQGARVACREGFADADICLM